jgi:hypothetical protein
METLNHYIDGGRKRDQATDLCGIENSYAHYGLVAQASLAAAAATATTAGPLMHRKPLTVDGTMRVSAAEAEM